MPVVQQTIGENSRTAEIVKMEMVIEMVMVRNKNNKKKRDWRIIELVSEKNKEN